MEEMIKHLKNKDKEEKIVVSIFLLFSIISIIIVNYLAKVL